MQSIDETVSGISLGVLHSSDRNQRSHVALTSSSICNRPPVLPFFDGWQFHEDTKASVTADHPFQSMRLNHEQ